MGQTTEKVAIGRQTTQAGCKNSKGYLNQKQASRVHYGCTFANRETKRTLLTKVNLPKTHMLCR